MLHANTSGNGKPIVILHGFLGMSDNWKSIANQLSESFEIHALDLRNHGKSFHANEFSYDLMALDVQSYIEENISTSVILIGHSMGGKVAMQLACQQPQLIKKLVIVDIGPKYYPPHHQQILEGLQAIDFSKKPSRAEVEKDLSEYIKDFGVRQFLLKNLYWQTPNQLAFRFNLKILAKKVEEIGKSLPTEYQFDGETLFMRGQNSNYILDEDWEHIVKQFPKSKLETIPNAGHWLHAEQPDLFIQKLLNFVNL